MTEEKDQNQKKFSNKLMETASLIEENIKELKQNITGEAETAGKKDIKKMLGEKKEKLDNLVEEGKKKYHEADPKKQKMAVALFTGFFVYLVTKICCLIKEQKKNDSRGK